MKRIIFSFFALIFLLNIYACSEDEYDGYFFNESYYKKSEYNIKSYYDELKIVQWNIGHFSGGGSYSSSITSDEYVSKIDEYRNLILGTGADIISLNEYSNFIGYDRNGNLQKANKVLFNNYGNQYIGKQRRYSCNALFSNLVLNNPVEIDFISNQTAQITHTAAIQATDYYFIESDIRFNGIDAKLVTAHLAFDLNNEDVARNQIMEIIDRYSYNDYVILCGDWNIMDVNNFDYFKLAGYQLANHGKYGDLITCGTNLMVDNVCVKGFQIKNVEIINSSLSDHKPLLVTLK